MTLPAWHLHPDVWLILGSVAFGYVALCRRHERLTGEATPPRTRRLFLAGMTLLFVASEWPTHDLAERFLYSAHMVQHMVFTLVAAPLLVAGTPAWLARAVLRPAALRHAFGFLVRPVPALVFFNGVLLFTHWPEVVGASVGSELTHFSLHVLIVFSGYVMWWPIVSPLPELPPLAPPVQMLYLFLQSLAPTIPASFLTFGQEPLYPIYATFPRIWGISALTDQLIAGLIMKIVGGAILWGVIATVFFRWANREQREGVDAVQWQRMEREMRPELNR
jgi:putative membrane protein